MTTTIFQAEVHTRHFHFEAYAATRSEAKAALRNALILHAAQYPVAGPDKFVQETMRDAEITEFVLGAPYRDRHEIGVR